MKLHIDGRKFDTKPENADIAGIKWRFTKPGSIHDLTVAQIANALTQGYTIEPGVCPYSEQTKAKGKSGTSDADFAEQTLFMVDIDNKRTDVERTTPEQAVAALVEHNLPLAFAYPTFHSTDEQERFRIALVSDEVFTDRTERDRVQAALIKLFPQADTDCKNADRIFFGTDKPLYDGIGDLNAVCRKADLLAFADSLLADEPETTAAAPVPAQNMNVPPVPAANGKTTTIRSNNRSGHTGVFQDSRSGKWRAEIMLQGKRKYLGRFPTLSDAVKAREKAKEQMHDEFIATFWENHEKDEKNT